MRNIFLVSLAIVVLLPLYDVLFIYPAFTELLTQNTRHDAIRVASHLTSLLIPEGGELDQRTLDLELMEEGETLEQVKDDFDLVQFRIFSKSGRVMYSSNPKDAGFVNTKEYFRDIVEKGRVLTNIVRKNAKSLEGEMMIADVMEAYVPIVRGDRILGAFEIYYDITAEKTRLDALLARSSVILFGLALGLFTVILIVLFRENRTITLRERAEDALKDSEERFRETADLLPTIVCEAGRDMTVIYMNRAGLETLGCSQSDLDAGMHIADLIHPDDRESASRYMREILQGAKGAATELRMPRKDGSVMVLFANFAPTRKDGQEIGIRAILTDITGQKRLQARLHEAQKMEAIGTLAGGIAHDFNNALLGITGNIELLRVQKADYERVKEYVDPMNDSARRMVQLTNQLLTYAQGGRYHPEIISLADFVQDALHSIKRAIRSDIHVETLVRDTVCRVEVDRTQMEMLLSAVLFNAAEATEGTASGRIRIVISSEEIGEASYERHLDLKPGRYVLLAVEDNGCGMDEETKRRIFEPFFSTKFPGRGLGMAAVYGIVRTHDGLVLVDSELGMGTTVRIYLPAAKSRQEKAKGPDPKE